MRVSVGGRVFGAVIGAFAAALAVGFFVWGVRAIWHGETTTAIGQRTGTVAVWMEGWTAYVFGMGLLAAGVGFGIYAGVFWMGVMGRGDAQRVMRLMSKGYRLLAVAAGLGLVAVGAEVFF